MPTSPIKPSIPIPQWATAMAMPLVMLILTTVIGRVIWSIETNTTSQKEFLSRIESQERRLAVLEQQGQAQTETLRQVVKTQGEEANRLAVIETILRMQQQHRPKETWEMGK